MPAVPFQNVPSAFWFLWQHKAIVYMSPRRDKGGSPEQPTVTLKFSASVSKYSHTQVKCHEAGVLTGDSTPAERPEALVLLPKTSRNLTGDSSACSLEGLLGGSASGRSQLDAAHRDERGPARPVKPGQPLRKPKPSWASAGPSWHPRC